MKPLVIVDLLALANAEFGNAMSQEIHRYTAPDRDVRVVGPEDDLEGAGIIVTGSPLMLGEETPWAKLLGDRLETAAASGTPVLGICLGHQLLASHFGSTLERWPETREGLAPIRFEPEGPFAGLTPPTVWTHRDHVTGLGPDLTPIASGGLGGVAAFAHRELPIWGVQCHPEASSNVLPFLPAESLKNFATATADDLDTPAAKEILARFGTLLKP